MSVWIQYKHFRKQFISFDKFYYKTENLSMTVLRAGHTLFKKYSLFYTVESGKIVGIS